MNEADKHMTDGGLFENRLDKTCASYTADPTRCGRFDDDDFRSLAMCCACGGGAR